MAKIPFEPNSIFVPAALTVEELEAGLSQLDRGEIAFDIFWDEHLSDFRQSMVVAIDETSDMLAGRLPYRWRRELQVQLKLLRGYVDIVDAFVAQRAGEDKARLN